MDILRGNFKRGRKVADSRNVGSRSRRSRSRKDQGISEYNYSSGGEYTGDYARNERRRSGSDEEDEG
jgi:hypothetical protein